MKYLMIAVLAFGLVGCGQVDRTVAKYTGYSTVCVDNVEYIQFTSGATVKYDTKGNVVTCK